MYNTAQALSAFVDSCSQSVRALCAALICCHSGERLCGSLTIWSYCSELWVSPPETLVLQSPAGHDLVIPCVSHAIAPWNRMGPPVANVPLQVVDDQRDQNDGSLAAMSAVSLVSTTTRSSNQDEDAQPQQLQYVTAELMQVAQLETPGRNGLNQQTGFANAAQQFEHAARDQTEMEVTRATANCISRSMNRLTFELSASTSQLYGFNVQSHSTHRQTSTFSCFKRVSRHRLLNNLQLESHTASQAHRQL